MRLSDIVNGISYSVDIRSITERPGNKLDHRKYADLYDYFVNMNGQSYHTLVNSPYKGIREEFCLLVNDIDIILITIEGYSLDYEIKQDLLTIYLYLKDCHEYPLKVPFIYSLDDLMTLYELDILLNQKYVDLFFIELVNEDLVVEYSLQIRMSKDFKQILRNEIDTYLENNIQAVFDKLEQSKPIITIREIIEDKNDGNKNVLSFRRYNWVDAKDFARRIFRNHEFEIAWAEDAWNIIMFNDVVLSDKIVKSRHSDYEYGDIILWLVAMYDLYFEYKIAAGYEYEDEADLLYYISNVDNAERYIGIYLKEKIYEKLNELLLDEEAPACEFYDIKNDNYVFCEESVAYEVFREEVKERREMIIKIIQDYFDNKTILISEFFEGTHWCENYFSIKEKEQKIIDKYDKILEKVREGYTVRYLEGDNEYEYDDEEVVEEDKECELEQLEDECKCYRSDAQQGEVYNWIENGMRF